MNPHWKPTAKEDRIRQMAKAGANLSRYCRSPITGERTRPCVKLELLQGNLIIAIATLKGEPLIDIADVADLRGIVYLGKADQHTWKADRWEKEIRARMS